MAPAATSSVPETSGTQTASVAAAGDPSLQSAPSPAAVEDLMAVVGVGIVSVGVGLDMELPNSDGDGSVSRAGYVDRVLP
jgi:hypothetical protein